MTSFGRPFKPASGGKPIVPGCSDKTSRSMYLAEQERPGSAVKLTTASRASAALEQYWQQQGTGSSSSNSSTNNSNNSTASAHSPSTTAERSAGQQVQQRGKHAVLPGGERELAHKTRDACWRDSVQLAHQPGTYIPDCVGTPKDIEEKEKGRTRGIPGYTGCQPPPGASRPPQLPSPVETSKWTAINAFDERRPRIKGIPGYTGHQPHNSSGNPAAAASSAQHSAYSTTQQGHAAAQQQTSLPQQGQTTASYGQQQQPQAAATATAQQQFDGQAAAAAYPTASVASTGSRISSPPLYFCDGVQVPPGQVPVPYSAPHSAAPAAQIYSTASACHGSGGGSSGGGAHQAEVMVISQRPTAGPQVAPAHASAQVADSAQFTARGQGRGQRTWQPPAQDFAMSGSPVQLGGGGGATGGSSSSSSGGGGGAGVAVRLGRPAIGPWCTTYSTTFVQQEAYNSLVQQFKEAAQQRQRGK